MKYFFMRKIPRSIHTCSCVVAAITCCEDDDADKEGDEEEQWLSMSMLADEVVEVCMIGG